MESWLIAALTVNRDLSPWVRLMQTYAWGWRSVFICDCSVSKRASGWILHDTIPF